jgi:hypothetical protein
VPETLVARFRPGGTARICGGRDAPDVASQLAANNRSVELIAAALLLLLVLHVRTFVGERGLAPGVPIAWHKTVRPRKRASQERIDAPQQLRLLRDSRTHRLGAALSAFGGLRRRSNIA